MDMIVGLSQDDIQNVDKSSNEYIFHMTKQAGPVIPGQKEKATPERIAPIKEYDVTKEAAKVASISPVERS